MNNMQEVTVYDFEKDICNYKSFTYVRDNVWEPMSIRTEFNIAAVGFTIRPYLTFKSDTTLMQIDSIKKVYKRTRNGIVEYIFYCDTELPTKGHAGKYIIQCI